MEREIKGETQVQKQREIIGKRQNDILQEHEIRRERERRKKAREKLGDGKGEMGSSEYLMGMVESIDPVGSTGCFIWSFNYSVIWLMLFPPARVQAVHSDLPCRAAEPHSKS